MKKTDESFELGRLHGMDEAEQKAKEAQAIVPVPKELEIYTDNMPYQRDRIVEEIKFFLKHEIVAKYEVGKRLLLMKEIEGIRRGGDRKSADSKSKCGLRTLFFTDILNEHFPGLSPRRAHEYILFARKATAKFKTWAEAKGNWAKALALLDSFEDKEIKALEAGEPVHGMTMEDIDKMTFMELKDEVRRLQKKDERGKEQLKEKEAEIARMQRQWKPTEKQFHGVLEGYRVHFDSLLSQIEPDAMKDRLGSYPDEPERDEPSNRMIAHYIEILNYIKNCVVAAAEEAADSYGTAEMFPEKVWRPGMGAEIVKELRETVTDEEYRKRKAAKAEKKG